MANISHSTIEIETEIRESIDQGIERFPIHPAFMRLSDDLYEREKELIAMLTSFYVDVQEERRNPIASE